MLGMRPSITLNCRQANGGARYHDVRPQLISESEEMQYPKYTHSKPVTGEEAETLLVAMERGEARSTPESKRTVARILTRRARNVLLAGPFVDRNSHERQCGSVRVQVGTSRCELSK